MSDEEISLIVDGGDNPVVRRYSGAPAPLLPVPLVPLPKTKQLEKSEITELDAEEGLEIDASLAGGAPQKKSIYDICKSTFATALVLGFIALVFPRDFFQPRPDEVGDDLSEMPSEQFRDFIKKHPGKVELFDEIWVEIAYLKENGENHKAAEVGGRYWEKEECRDDEDWRKVWDVYLATLNNSKQVDKRNEVARALYGMDPDSLPATRFSIEADFKEFNSDYLSVQGKESKSKNKDKVQSLGELLTLIENKCDVGIKNLGKKKSEASDDYTHIFKVEKARALFCQWKLIGHKDRWNGKGNNTGYLAHAINLLKADKSDQSEELEKEIQNYCGDYWGWRWETHTVNGGSYSKKEFKKVLEPNGEWKQ